MKRLVLLIVAVGTAASVAELDARPRDKSSKSTYDPDQMVCTRQRDTGSRLMQSRVCMTQREWEIFRREQRQAIDRAQTNRVHPMG